MMSLHSNEPALCTRSTYLWEFFVLLVVCLGILPDLTPFNPVGNISADSMPNIHTYA